LDYIVSDSTYCSENLLKLLTFYYFITIRKDKFPIKIFESTKIFNEWSQYLTKIYDDSYGHKTDEINELFPFNIG